MSKSLERLNAALSDRYMIVRELGAGGMATVYLAEDLKHQRNVALKVLRPELAAVIGAERFLAEIKTTANLQHPHILPLHDSGEVDGTVYYVMPFIEGESLRDRLDREKQLPINEAVGIASEVAGALDYAHRQGVVHRDIKPENILLHDRRALVADFGIALAASRSDGEGRLTETGMSLGTPHYMSPEQAMGERDLDARADVYVATVATAIQKLPADRFTTAAAFADALAGERAQLADVDTAQAPSAHSGLTWVLAGATLAAFAIAGWAFLRPTPTAPVLRYALALPPSQAPDPANLAVPLPDGSRIVFVGPGEATPRQLWVKNRDQYAARPLAGTDAVTNFAVSPDGASVAVHIGGVMTKVPIDGGAPSSVVDAEVASRIGGITWLDDGTIAYVMTGGGYRIARVSEDGGESTVIFESDSVTVDALQPLPGARGLLFQVCVPPCVATDVWVLDLETGEVKVVDVGASSAQYLSTGHLALARTTGALLVVPFDLQSLEVRGSAVAVLDSVAAAGSIPLVSISASGTLVMRAGASVELQEFEFVWVDQQGGVTIADSTESFRHITVAANYGWALSPDESQVAIGLTTSAGEDIWVKSLPRGPLSRVSYGADTEYRPRWMPDGRSIIFSTRGEGEGAYYRRADGTGDDVRVVSGLFDEVAASPDGRSFVFRSGAVSAASGGRDLLAMEIGVDSTPQPLLATPYDEMAFRISTDSRAIAYQSDETGRVEIFVRPFPDVEAGRIQVSNGGGTGPLWSRDGSEVYYRNKNYEMVADRCQLLHGVGRCVRREVLDDA